MYLQAAETVDPTSFATVEVQIFIDDANDNKPLFQSQVYPLSVPENTPNGTVIKRGFDAVDHDVTVSYS